MNLLHLTTPRLFKGEFILAPIEVLKLKVFINEGKSIVQLSDIMLDPEMPRIAKSSLMREIIQSCGRQYPTVFKPELLETIL